jgi:hypothetical protein
MTKIPCRAFKSGGNESADGTIKFVVSALGPVQSDDFKRKWKPRAWSHAGARQ